MSAGVDGQSSSRDSQLASTALSSESQYSGSHIMTIEIQCIHVQWICIEAPAVVEPKLSLVQLCMYYYYINLHNNREIYVQSA